MDLLYDDRVDVFCIASSDSDFTRLAARLRESEKIVIGMGKSDTPKSFVSACNKFSYLDILYREAEARNKARKNKNRTREDGVRTLPNAPEILAEPSGLDLQSVKLTIQTVIEENSGEDGWIHSGVVAQQLVKRLPDFDVRNFKYKKFVPFIESLEMCDIWRIRSKDQDEQGATVMIRMRPQE